MSFGAPFPASRREVLYSFTARAEQTATGAAFNFTGLNFGTADPDRYLVACITWQASVAGVVTACTIGGVAATQVVQSSLTTGNRGSAIFIAKVPTGASGTVSISLSDNAGNAAVAVYSVIGIPSAAAASSASSISGNPTASLNVAINGVVIAVAVAGAGSPPSASWSGLTEDCDNNYGTSNFQCRSSASQKFTTAQVGLSVTCTFSTSAGSAGCFAVFEPA